MLCCQCTVESPYKTGVHQQVPRGVQVTARFTTRSSEHQGGCRYHAHYPAGEAGANSPSSCCQKGVTASSGSGCDRSCQQTY